jgi:hypothetical protein
MMLDFQGRVTGQNTTGQAITATAVSTDSIDLITTGRRLGDGEQINFRVTVGSVAFNNLTSLRADIITSAAVGLGTPTTVVTGNTVLLAALTAGAVVLQGTIPANVPLLQFLGVQFTVAGTAPTTGACIADIGMFDLQGSFTGGPA